jgi:hypothetical protein
VTQRTSKTGAFLWKEGENMAVNAEDVFTIAMNLMEETTQDGTFDGYPDEYKDKAWSILNILQSELLPVAPTMIRDKGNLLTVDDRTARMTLPYGLAAHLLLSEDPMRASFFNDRYDELKRKRSATVSKIKDVYGISTSSSEST